jgi:ABC-type transport system substrate-binding protein
MSNDYWSKTAHQRLSRRRLLATASAAASALFLAACSGDESGGTGDKSGLISQPEDTTRQANRGGLMKDRTFGDPPTLDIFTANNPLNAVDPHCYSTLVQFKPGYLKPPEVEVIPDLAESWESSPDGLQITMKLRQGVKLHSKPPVNGRTFGMDDLLFSWNRFATKSSGRTGIVNAADPRAPVLSLTATDATTVVIKLKEPIVFALNLFASNQSGGVIMLPKETDTTLDIRGDMIGTGPFVLSNYTPSVAFTFKRHPDYYDKDYAFVEQVDLPIIPEYATSLSQFKAGNIYSFGSYHAARLINPEDVLPAKREEPRILVYQGDLRAPTDARLMGFGWLPAGKSPFLDERVRQAISMSWDRDIYLDTFQNVSQFNSEGLPVETRWNSALSGSAEGWWLDPKSSDFGPNAKYFRYDPAEAKKLLAAAGFPSGLEVISNYVTGPELPTAKHAAVIDGFASEIGITSKANSIDYSSQYIPQFRDGKGQFEGWVYKTAAGGGSSGDATAILAVEYWSKGGSPPYHGFSASGQNDQSGDPQVDALIEKARLERDTEKRRDLVFDVQRYLAKPMYALQSPGVASIFTVAWPCLANFRVYSNAAGFGARPNYRLWVDETKAPIAKT